MPSAYGAIPVPTMYWLTGTGASAARSYWEGGQATARAAGQAPPEVKLPVGFTTFPGEIFKASCAGRPGLLLSFH